MNETYVKNPNPPFVFSRWEVFKPLRQHAYFIWLFVLSAALSALFITYIYSDKYEAQVTMMLKPTEVTRLTAHPADTEALGAPVPQLEYKIVEQTLQDLVQSEPVLRDVVTKLHLDAPVSRDYSGLPVYQRWCRESKDWFSDYGGDAWSVLKYGRVIHENPTNKAIETLAKNVSIDSQDSYVFVLKVRDKHYDRVDAIANELAQELRTTLRDSEQAAAQTRSAELRVRLAKKYSELESEEIKVRNVLEVARTPSIADEIDKDLGQYAELKSTWLDLHSQISQTRATVAAYDTKLSTMGMAPIAGQQRLSADDFKKMASDRLTAQVALDGLLHKSASLDESLERLDRRLQELPRLQVEYDLLDTNRTRSKRDYSQINDALQEEILQEENSVTALVVAGLAVATNQPVAPIKIYHVALATILGMLLAIGMAFVLGYFEVRVFMSAESIRERPPPTAARAIPPLTGDTVPGVD